MRNIGAALAEEPIHERGLPVIDVSYHGNIAESTWFDNGAGSDGGRRRWSRGGGGGEWPRKARTARKYIGLPVNGGSRGGGGGS